MWLKQNETKTKQKTNKQTKTNNNNNLKLQEQTPKHSCATVDNWRQAFTGEFSLWALQSSPGTSKESTRRAF